MELVEFLLARIAEDEAVARAATPSPWVPGSQGWDDADGRGIIVAPYHELDIRDDDAEHVTRWEPARVLAECEAKRRLVEWAGRHNDAAAEYADLVTLQYARNAAMRALDFLALPYADHPDYQREWRP